MKKIIMANDLSGLLPRKETLLGRADLKVLLAATHDEMLAVYNREKADLILAQLDLPGMRAEELFGTIRNSRELREVSVIIVCQDTLANRERCKQCRANAVLTLPVDPEVLSLKLQHFLNVAPRMLYRAALAVAISGRFKNRPMPFWTENISASGMLIRAEEPLETGYAIFFSYFLPDGTHVSGYGEIVRAVQLADRPDSFLYGIRFTNIDADAKAAIDGVVRIARRRAER
jgi:CheY-like chemotaxis protein